MRRSTHPDRAEGSRHGIDGVILARIVRLSVLETTVGSVLRGTADGHPDALALVD
jgi:hypothetical protein